MLQTEKYQQGIIDVMPVGIGGIGGRQGGIRFIIIVVV
jgi:hypothetical protein